jgi:transposase
MQQILMTVQQRYRLRMQLKTTNSARVYRRTLAILEVAAGHPVAEVAKQLGVNRRSIYNWIDAYLVHQSPVALVDCDGRGRRTIWTEELEALLRESLSRAPDHWSLAAVNWTVPLLREHLGHYGNVWLSESSIRRKLHQLGYVWKRPRYVLQPDPDREKKTMSAKYGWISVTP